MKLSTNNIDRIKRTVLGTSDATDGIHGSSFFALLRCIRMFGEPIKCDKDNPLYGLKALRITDTELVAVRRTVYKGGFSKCNFYLLEHINESLN